MHNMVMLLSTAPGLLRFFTFPSLLLISFYFFQTFCFRFLVVFCVILRCCFVHHKDNNEDDDDDCDYEEGTNKRWNWRRVQYVTNDSLKEQCT